MELKLQIDRGLCCGCQACVKECPGKVLEMNGGVPAVAPGGEERCMRCQHCLAVCPTGALSIFGRDPADSVPGDGLPEPEQMVTLIKNRRSCRNYRRENLTRPTLDLLLDTLSWSPTGVNDHRLHYSVIDDCAVMDRVRRELSGRVLSAIRSGTLPPELENFRRFERALENQVDVFCRTAPHLLIVAAPKDSPCPKIDPVIALSYFELLAHTLHVGTTWCGLIERIFRYLAPELPAQFGVPDGYRVGYVMLFGLPNVRFHRGTQPTLSPVNRIRF